MTFTYRRSSSILKVSYSYQLHLAKFMYKQNGKLASAVLVFWLMRQNTHYLLHGLGWLWAKI